MTDGVRRAAFAVAYRMLGSVHDAEDVVQETLLRLHRAGTSGVAVASPEAFAATVATRLSLNHLRSARVRRETYVGAWLPEPLLTGDGDDPAVRAELGDSLSVAFLVLLERLTPEQRAAFLLHDVFGYGYDEVARIVGTSRSNARQLVARARRLVVDGRPRFTAPRERQDELADRFFAAALRGDLGALEALLAGDAELRGDGGGNAPALARAVHGRARVARTLLAWFRAGLGTERAALRPARFNDCPGALAVDPAGRTICVLTLEVDGEHVRSVSSVINPDKLTHLGAVADVRALLRGR